MKKYLLSIALTAFYSFNLFAQQTREMTPGEIAFNQRVVDLIFEAIPHENFKDWTLATHKNKDFDKRIAVSRPKNVGSYAYSHELVFNRPFEQTQAQLDQVSKQMEGVTDNAKISAFSKTLQEITLNAEMRVRITINSEHTALSDCSGKAKYPTYLDKDYHWGVNILHAAQIPTSDDRSGVCKNETRIIIGKSKPFQFYKYDSDKGGTLVSAIKLPKDSGDNAFKIYNIVISVEASPQDVQTFLGQIKWKLMNNSLRN